MRKGGTGNQGSPKKTQPTQPIPVPVQAKGNGWWDFFENPITLLVVAVVLGAVGLILYTPILIFCVVLMAVALYRSKAVEGKPLKRQVLAYVAVVGCSSLALYGVDVLLYSRLDAGLSVQPITAFRSDSRSGGAFVITYTGSQGDTLSPLNYVAAIRVLNKSPYPIRLESCSAEIATLTKIFESQFGELGTRCQESRYLATKSYLGCPHPT